MGVQAQRRARIHKLRLEKGAEKATEEFQKCDKLFSPSPSIWCLGGFCIHFTSTFLVPCFTRIFYADDPNNDPNISGDPYKTLFVARLVSINDYTLYHFSIFYPLLNSLIYFIFYIFFTELWDNWEQNQKGVWGLWANQAGRYFRASPSGVQVIDFWLR